MEKITMEEEKERKEMKAPRWYKPLLFLFIFIIAGSSTLLIYHGLTGRYPWKFGNEALLSEGMSDEQIRKALQEATDRSAFRFRINSRPVFMGSDGEGALFIENPKENRYLMQVTIRLKESGEVIYETKAIRPGEGIGSDRLFKKLKPGEYDALAHITAVDPVSGGIEGSAQAQMKLTIK